MSWLDYLKAKTKRFAQLQAVAAILGPGSGRGVVNGLWSSSLTVRHEAHLKDNFQWVDGFYMKGWHVKGF